MAFQELGAKSGDGKSIITVVAHVQQNGEPKVVVIVKKDANVVFDTTLDGVPAFGFMLGELSEGDDNGPWELGHLLAQKWAEAKEKATKK